MKKEVSKKGKTQLSRFSWDLGEESVWVRPMEQWKWKPITDQKHNVLFFISHYGKSQQMFCGSSAHHVFLCRSFQFLRDALPAWVAVHVHLVHSERRTVSACACYRVPLLGPACLQGVWACPARWLFSRNYRTDHLLLCRSIAIIISTAKTERTIRSYLIMLNGSSDMWTFNHRIFKVGKVLQEHPVQPSTHAHHTN